MQEKQGYVINWCRRWAIDDKIAQFMCSSSKEDEVKSIIDTIGSQTDEEIIENDQMECSFNDPNIG
jgi:hypothetical protein